MPKFYWVLSAIILDGTENILPAVTFRGVLFDCFFKVTTVGKLRLFIFLVKEVCKMKRILSLLLAVVMIIGAVFTLSSCGETETETATLKVGLECNYAPFNWTQADNSNNAVKISGTSQYANGYDVQIARKIAEGLGLELEIVKLSWDGLIPAVQSGAIDMIIAGMSPTDERKLEIDFSDPYYTSQLVVVVRKDGKYADAKNLEDLSGASIVGQVGTFHETVIEQIPNVNKVDSMKDFPQMIIALNSKTIDGYVAEEPGAKADTAANPDLTYVPLKNNDTGFTATDADVAIAIGMKKGNENLGKINEILTTISDDERLSIMEQATANQPAGE